MPCFPTQKKWMFHSLNLGREKTWTSGYEIFTRPHMCWQKTGRERERDRKQESPQNTFEQSSLESCIFIAFLIMSTPDFHKPFNLNGTLPFFHSRLGFINPGLTLPLQLWEPTSQPRHWKALLRLHGAQLQLLQRHHLAGVDLAGAVDHAIGAFVDASAGDGFPWCFCCGFIFGAKSWKWNLWEMIVQPEIVCF